MSKKIVVVCSGCERVLRTIEWKDGDVPDSVEFVVPVPPCGCDDTGSPEQALFAKTTAIRAVADNVAEGSRQIVEALDGINRRLKGIDTEMTFIRGRMA